MGAYTPSLWRINKYSKYLAYFWESLKRLDFQSIVDSINYVVFKKLPQTPREVETFMGKFLLRKNTTDFQFVNYTYEKEVKDYIEANKNNIGAFIDVGACIGEYCIWLSKKGIQSYAVEPVNFPAIEYNVKLNKVDLAGKLTVMPYALGNENKNVSFNVMEGVTSSSYINSEVEGGDIECKRFDSIFNSQDFDPFKITMVKLDVEGMELDVLRGAEKFIRSTRNLELIIEHTSCGIKSIKKLLNQYGNFSYFDLDGVNTLVRKHQYK